MNKGKYIVIEGIVGSGKTTQAKLLVKKLIDKFPHKEFLYTREPGGTEISESIRKVVQATLFEEEMHPICEAYLYAASRAQSLRALVNPALEKGSIVISDRNFITSLTNQAFGRNIGLEEVYKINEIAIRDTIPDLVIHLKTDINKALSRIADHKGDKFESFGKDFYEKVDKAHDDVAKMDIFQDRWITINNNRSIEEISEEVFKTVEKYL